MSVELFRYDDRGYTAWLTENACRYVVNIQHSMNRSDASVHETACRGHRHAAARPDMHRPYVKACSSTLIELDAWALSHAGSAITRGTCQPSP